MTETLAWAEVVARQFSGESDGYRATPGALAQYMDHTIVQTPMLDQIDQRLVQVMQGRRKRRGRGPRLIVCTPPQEGKSQRVSRAFPLWALLQNPNLRIAVASYEAGVAIRWGRLIRSDIEAHPELGLRVSEERSAAHDWELEGRARGSVYSVGVGGALTGRPVDLMIIDDPVKDREDADSETMRDKVWDWWQDVVSTRLSPGAPVVLVMTRWHPDDLAGRLLATGDWELLSIPAQCEDPATDPLQREEGEFLQSARGTTTAEWEDKKADRDTRSWMALFQQRPVPAEGLVFHEEWINQHRRPSGDGDATWVRRLVGVDPAATSTTNSDETGIVVVALDHKGHAWVLDDRSCRGSPLEWGTAVWRALLAWGCDEVVVEDNQGGEMVVSVLETAWDKLDPRETQRVLTPVITRVKAVSSKRVRAESVAALYEKGKVHHADDGTGRLDKLETQMTTWTGGGKSPDRMDALVHALKALTTPRHTAQSSATAKRKLRSHRR